MENETIEIPNENEAPAAPATIDTVIPVGWWTEPKIPPYVGD